MVVVIVVFWLVWVFRLEDHNAGFYFVLFGWTILKGREEGRGARGRERASCA